MTMDAFEYVLNLVSANNPFVQIYIKRKKTNKAVKTQIQYFQKALTKFRVNQQTCKLCTNCNISDSKIDRVFIQDIMSVGWGELSKHEKECEHVLIIIDAIRRISIHYLHSEFNNNFKSNTHYTTAGSNNLTSDYDITLIGPKSMDMAKYIYERLKRLSINVPFSMDTNLYFLFGFNSHMPFFDNLHRSLSNNVSEKHLYPIIKLPNHDIFALQPTNNKTLLLCTYLLFYKFKVTGIQNESVSTLLTSLYPPEFMVNEIHNIFKRFNLNKNQLYLNCNLNNNKTIDTCYKKSFDIGKILMDKFNDEKYHLKYLRDSSEEFLIFLLCIFTMKHSIEGYHTPCSMNVVVYELQMGVRFKKRLNVYNYFVALIENIIDLLVHNTKNDLHYLMKNTKYMYRIDYCLENIIQRIEQRVKYKHNNPFHTNIKKAFKLRGTDKIKEQEQIFSELAKGFSKSKFTYEDYVHYISTHPAIINSVFFMSDHLSM